jgi:hypothetical protein
MENEPLFPCSAPGNAARALVAELDRLVAGLSFISESDHPYVAFAAALDPSAPLTVEALRTLLPWSEGPAGQPEYEPPPVFRLEVIADDSFWLEEAERDLDHASAYHELDQWMMRSFVEASIRTGREVLTARIFSVTLPEVDAALAPFFLVGRLGSGGIVGVRTFRLWT